MAKKKAGTEIVTKTLTHEQQKEYMRCMFDIAYFAETYCQVKEKATGRKIAFKLFPHQLKTIEAYQNHRFNLILKYRQGGITTTTCLYIAWLLTFTPNCEIAVVANTMTLAQENIFTLIVDIINNLPDWLRMEVLDKDSQKKKVYENGSVLQALAAAKDGTRGMSPDLVFVDEAAYLQYGEQFMTATMGALSAGGNIILNSTPKGMDPVYYAKYEQSLEGGENTFNVVEIFWYQDPRFIRDTQGVIDLRWIKTIEGQEVSISTTDPDVYHPLMSDGYKPTSSWFEKRCADYDYDPKRIAQELSGSFIGSGGNLIADEYILEMERTTVRVPDKTNEREDSKFWFWGNKQSDGSMQYIKPDGRYQLYSDVSKGTGEDYSTIAIFEVHPDGMMEQVAELQCKYPPEVLAERINTYGRLYNNAYVVVDVTGGIGAVTMDNLLRFEYPINCIHQSEIRSKPIRDRLLKHMNEKQMVPGFAIGANRDLILEELERRIRHGEIIIRSRRLTTEFKSFVFVNGRYDHERSKHDDILMAVAMGLYAFKFSFCTLQGPSFEQVMLQANAWKTVTQEDYDQEWMVENHKNESQKYVADPFRDDVFSRESPVLPFYF